MKLTYQGADCKSFACVSLDFISYKTEVRIFFWNKKILEAKKLYEM